MGQVSNGNKIQRILNLASWEVLKFLKEKCFKN